MLTHYFTILALLASVLSYFLHPQITATAICDGLESCIHSVFPSLFPCFVAINLWFQLGYGEQTGKKLGKYTEKLFNLPPDSITAILIGSIGGFPAGAQAVKRLYAECRISKKHAEYLLMFCNNAGPAFIIGFVGNYLFQSPFIGLILWLIHLASAILIAFLAKPDAKIPHSSFAPRAPQQLSFMTALSKSILDAGSSVIKICCLILFFTLSMEHMEYYIPSKINNSIFFLILKGALELTSGILSLNSIPQVNAFIFVSAMLGWNGFCVHCQVSSVIGTDLSMRKYYFGKVLHILISTILCLIILPIMPFEMSYDVKTIIFLIPLLLISLILISEIIYAKTSSGNRRRIGI